MNYNQGRGYSKAQIQMIQRTVGVGDDGQWGPSTIAAIRTWQDEKGMSADGRVGPKTLAALFEAALGQQPGLWPVTTVGAWTGQTSFKKIDQDVQFCVDHGINRLDVIVNDHSKWRAARDFNTYTPDKIISLCKAARDAGLEVHLMSWVMPHAAYIDQAAEQLRPLCEQTGAASLMWDAEEPWNQAVDPMPYEDAAERIASGFAGLSCPMSLTGIIYTKVDKLAPLARICDTLVPQCYATSSSGSPSPDSVVSTGVERWRKSFGSTSNVVVGLAAYRQEGFKGRTVASAMQSSIQNVRAYALDTVVYWSLRQIEDSPEVAEFIRTIRGTTPATDGTPS